MSGDNKKIVKVVRDPIYGYIDITEDQLEVINLPVFQRLRRITQLSFTDAVYPNATHNRFSHSLGTMHLARIVSRYLEKSGEGRKAGLDKLDYEALEWAGLLHDIGHLPFSHVSEPAFAHFIGKTSEWKDYHVKIGVKILEDPSYGIKKVIPKEVLQRVISLINKGSTNTCRLLKGIMTGKCSIDRLDYLKRDAYHAGTPEYAIIDYERILTSIIHCKAEPLRVPVFKRKALYALEGVILSYFYMYKAMYHHHAVRSAFLLFQDIIWDAFDKANLKADLKDLFNPQFWNDFDDHKFLTLLRSKKGKAISTKLKRLTFRDLPKRIKEIGSDSSDPVAKK